MEAKAVVAAFSESPMLRETLAVLLEGDCQLQFLSPGTTAPVAALSPDLALLATATPAPLLARLARHWPRLPIVAIDPTQIGGSAAAAAALAGAGIETVGLEPEAIRTAVISLLPARRPDDLLRVIVAEIGETLGADLRYSLTMLRAVPALCTRGGSRDTDSILASILCEQAAVIGAHVEQLERFRTRPRPMQVSEQFVSALCRQLEQADAATTQRGLLCACSLDTAAPAVPGPVALVPLVATLVRAHLRRRSELSVITVRAAHNRVSMRYALRSAAQAHTRSWPLLLASLVLESWSWRISTSVGDGHETLSVFGVGMM